MRLHRAIVTKASVRSMVQSLAELRAENAKLEDKAANSPHELVADSDEIEVEDETVETDEVSEPDEEEALDLDTDATDEEQPQVVEDWMQSDDSQESQDAEKKFTDGDVAAARRKLKAKLEDKNSEVEKLKSEIETLKNGPANQQNQSVKKRPMRSDFDELDDPESSYIDALTDWKIDKRSAESEAKLAATQSNDRADKQKQVINTSLDQHYERAVKLAEKSNIKPETYQSADLNVRKAIESVFPNSGDSVTDMLIANVGEGSEKVFYNLGVNNAKLNVLTDHLKSDPSGLKAVAYLGKLTGELNAPQKRKTQAPKPTAKVTGNNASSATQNAMKKKYERLHASGDTQKAFSLKRQAKKAGTDTTTW